MLKKVVKYYDHNHLAMLFYLFIRDYEQQSVFQTVADVLFLAGVVIMYKAFKLQREEEKKKKSLVRKQAMVVSVKDFGW